MRYLLIGLMIICFNDTIDLFKISDSIKIVYSKSELTDIYQVVIGF